MIKLQHLTGKSFGVFGLGRSGLATCLSLQESGANVFAWDDAEEKRHEAKKLAIAVKPVEQWDWSTIEALLLSPGIPHHFPKAHSVALQAREKQIPIIVDIDLLMEETKASFIGITGTNGKSTTTALVGHLLKNSQKEIEVGGNIGLPVLGLPQLSDQGTYVLELSSYQLERLPHLVLKTAVLTNITPDHLDRHGGIDGYVAAKESIFKANNLKTVVIGVDDSYSLEISERLKLKNSLTLLKVGRSADSQIQITPEGLRDNHFEKGQIVCRFEELPWALGQHNWQNAAIAYAVARAEGVSLSEVLKNLKTFKNLSHRIENVGTLGNIHFVNDSKATSVEAATKALSCFDNIYWILGGRHKNESLEPFNHYLSQVHSAFLIGEAADEFAGYFKEKASYQNCGTLENALRSAYEEASQKSHQSVILLSPACASFDQFSDFEERGNVFRTLVQKLIQEESIAECRGL